MQLIIIFIFNELETIGVNYISNHVVKITATFFMER